MPKAVPNSREPLALSAAGSSMPTLDRFSADSDRQRVAVQDAMNAPRSMRMLGLIVLAVLGSSGMFFAGRCPEQHGAWSGAQPDAPKSPTRATEPTGSSSAGSSSSLSPTKGQLTDSAVQRPSRPTSFPISSP